MQHRPARTLCICADDHGLRPGINDAIEALLDRGVLHAVSCMVGGPAWAAGAAALRRHDRARVDLGLHLDLTDSPLLPGSRWPLGRLIATCMARLVRPEALRREIDAQLDAFEQALGGPPSYVDGHQHVHQLPVVRTQLLAALHARYGQALPWLRATRSVQGGPGGSPKARLIEHLGGTTLVALADAQGLRHNTRLLGVYDFQGGATRYQALLAGWLQAALSGDLLMCHPGTGHDAGDSIAAARVAEFEVLAGDGLRAMLEAEGLHLAPISRWLAGAPA